MYFLITDGYHTLVIEVNIKSAVSSDRNYYTCNIDLSIYLFLNLYRESLHENANVFLALFYLRELTYSSGFFYNQNLEKLFMICF